MSHKMEDWEEVEQKVIEDMEEMFIGGKLTDLVVRKKDMMVVRREVTHFLLNLQSK